MSIPKIDIIIPAYNAEKSIGKCLEALYNQSFQDFNVIIINDGSTDKTLEIIQTYIQKDSRFNVFSQSNQGTSIARNKGYELSSAAFITYVDADDYMTKDALTHLYTHITKYNNDYVIGSKRKMAKDGELEDFLPKLFAKDIPSITPKDLKLLKQVRFHIALHAKLIRKSFLEKQKIAFVKHWTYEDYLYSYSLLLQAKSIGIVAYNCYYYIYYSTSISHTPIKEFNIRSRWETEESLWRICKQYDSKYKIYDNPQSMTINNRFYRHIDVLGIKEDEEEEKAYNLIKNIIQDNYKIIKKTAKGIKKITYLCIYYLNFQDFIKIKKELTVLSPALVKIVGTKMFLNNEFAKKIHMNENYFIDLIPA